MATNKTITVTVIPTLEGDTIASYNAYSSVDGSLGTMTTGEAAAGKIFSLSAANHNITVKGVWTISGETTTVGSNVVAVDVSAIFEDDFTGSTIDVTTNWNLTEPNATFTEFTQNDELIVTNKGNGTVANYLNSLTSQTGIALSSIVSYTFDLKITAQNDSHWTIGLTKDIVLADNDDRLSLQFTATAGKLSIIMMSGGSSDHQVDAATLDLSTVKTIKMTNIGGFITWYYWTTSWTIIGVTKAHTYTGDWYPVISGGDIATKPSIITVDNLKVLGFDFATLRP